MAGLLGFEPRSYGFGDQDNNRYTTALYGGEGGIRTLGPLVAVNSFQDCRFKPTQPTPHMVVMVGLGPTTAKVSAWNSYQLSYTTINYFFLTTLSPYRLGNKKYKTEILTFPY